MARNSSYTTQLQAGLGMIHETLDLLRLWEPGDSPIKLAEKAISAGVFSRTTARRARNIVAEMFAPRFLAAGGGAARYLKEMVDTDQNMEDLKQLFYLYTARAQSIFADFVTEVYWPRYAAGAHHINRVEAESFVHQALHAGKMQKRWTETTIRRVSGYLLGCCADFGLISTRGKTNSVINRFAVRRNVVLYLVYDLHFSGLGDFGVMSESDWRLFGLEQNEVINHVKSLANDGHLIVQATSDLVQIEWKYSSMEHCIRAITER
jgi:hypothetical protein